MITITIHCDIYRCDRSIEAITSSPDIARGAAAESDWGTDPDDDTMDYCPIHMRQLSPFTGT